MARRLKGPGHLRALPVARATLLVGEGGAGSEEAPRGVILVQPLGDARGGGDLLHAEHALREQRPVVALPGYASDVKPDQSFSGVHLTENT